MACHDVTGAIWCWVLLHISNEGGMDFDGLPVVQMLFSMW
jgi:hypothetical protein